MALPKYAVIRSKKSIATLLNRRSFWSLDQRDKKGTPVENVRTINDKLRKDRDSRIKTKT